MFQHVKNWVYKLLRRGERYTGTDNVYLAKGGFWFTLAQFLGSASSLLLAILFSHFIKKETYGTYQYFLSWGSILALASLTGMSGALTRAVAQGNDRTLFSVLKARLRWGLLGTAAGLAVGGYYLTRSRPDLFWGFAIIGAAFPAMTALSAWVDYAIGKKRFDLHARYNSLETLAAAAALVAAILFHANAITLVAAFALAHLLANGLGYWLTLRRIPPTGGIDAESLRYGRRLTRLDLLTNLATYLDRIIIFTLLGSQETAVYAFAIAPPEQLKGYLKNLHYLALPKVAARPIAEIRPTFFKKYFLMMGIVAGMVGIYVVAAPWLYRLLFPNYLEAIGLSQLFSLSLVTTAAVLPSAIFIGHEKYAENTRYQLTTSAVNIVLLAVFVWKWGLLGAVLARIVGRFFGLAYSTILVRKIFKEAV